MRILPVCVAILACVWIPIHAGWVRGADSLPDASGERTAATVQEQGDPTATGGSPSMAAPQGVDRAMEGPEPGRDDASGRMARVREEKARLEDGFRELMKDAVRNQADARAVVVGLYKYKQMRYFAFLLSANGLEQAVESAELTNRSLRDDYRVLADLRARALNLNTLEALLSRKERELSDMKTEMSASGGGGYPVGKQQTGDSVQLLERVVAAVPSEEIRKNSERRTSTRKPILLFGEVPFAARRGALPLPTPGEIVATYGTRPKASAQSILHSNGVLIAAHAGEPIHAIHEGLVMFADVLKDYGKVMIVNHGDHYYSLIAHAGELARKAGESVKAGETIATVESTAAGRGQKLYFEIRHHGKPVDPMEWLAVQKSSRE